MFSSNASFKPSTNIRFALTHPVAGGGGGGGGSLVLKTIVPNATQTRAVLYKNISGISEGWLTFDIAIETNTLADFLNPCGSGYFGMFYSNLDVQRCAFYTELSSGNYWFLGGDGGFIEVTSPIPIAGVWQAYELHFLSNNTCELYINGSLVANYTDGNSSVSDIIVIGQNYPCTAGINDTVYFRNVKIGSTRGSSDIFTDDFSGGDLSNWDAIVGNCTLVPDPY